MTGERVSQSKVESAKRDKARMYYLFDTELPGTVPPLRSLQCCMFNGNQDPFRPVSFIRRHHHSSNTPNFEEKTRVTNLQDPNVSEAISKIGILTSSVLSDSILILNERSRGNTIDPHSFVVSFVLFFVRP